MAKEICTDCGNIFDAGPYSFLCKSCRRIRLSETAKARNLNKLGNDAYSKQQAQLKAKRSKCK